MMAHSKHLCVIGFEERLLSETVIDWDSPNWFIGCVGGDPVIVTGLTAVSLYSL